MYLFLLGKQIYREEKVFPSDASIQMTAMARTESELNQTKAKNQKVLRGLPQGCRVTGLESSLVLSQGTDKELDGSGAART